MAGLIPQAFIDDLLRRIDIVDVIDRRVRLKRTGRNYSACCPFHQEKTPSFSVSPEKQFYHCFGCGVSGNALGFIMAFEGLDFPGAVESLAASAGLEVPRQEMTAQAEQAIRKQKELVTLLSQAADFYRKNLIRSPRAMQYLVARGLSPKVIEDFGIGYAPAGWDDLMRHLSDVGWQISQLVDSGLLVEKEDSGRRYDRFRDRIMFPIRDSKGQIIGFGGRVLGDEKPKYLNSPETVVFSKGRELYGLYEANRSHGRPERLVVVEGYMDVVALAQFGVTYAVAALGTALGSFQIAKAFRCCDELVFCFDGDAAGRRAAEKALDASLPLLDAGKRIGFLFLSDGEDPDSYIRSRGMDDFVALLDMAQPLSSYLFEALGGGLSLESAEGRAGLVTRALPELCRIPEGPFRKQMFMELALRTRSDIHSLEQMAAGSGHTVSAGLADLPDPLETGSLVTDRLVNDEKSETSLKTRGGTSGKGAASSADLVLLQKEIARILVAFPQFAGLIIERLGVNIEDADMSLLSNLAALVKTYPGASASRLMGLWHGLYPDPVSNQWLAGLLEKGYLMTDAERVSRHLNDTLNRLLAVLNRETPLERLISLARERPLTEPEKQKLKQLLSGSTGK